MREQARGVLAQCYQAFENLNGFTDRLVKTLGEAASPAAPPVWANPETFSGWHHTLTQLMQRARAANSAFLTLEEGPLRQAGTYDEFESARDNLRANLTDLNAVAEELATLEAAIKAEENLAVSIAADERAAEGAHEEAVRAKQDAAAHGFIVTFATAALQEAQHALEVAKAKRAEKHYTVARQHYRTATEGFKAVAQTMAGIPARRDALRKAWDALTTRRNALTKSVPTVQATLTTLEATYAPEAFAVVNGNGTEAEKRLSAVPEMAKAIGGLLEEQAWDQASAALESAGEVLDEAEMLFESITIQAKRLGMAAKDAAEELAEAKRSIGVAVTFLTQHPHHVQSDDSPKLDQADALCREVEEELAKPLPNPLTAYAKASQADDLADHVYGRAVEAEEQLQQRKRRAMRERREVLAQLETVERYFKNHRRDIGNRAQSELDVATGLAKRIRAERDASAVIELARQLNDRLEVAQRRASSDFHQAEQTRASARRRSESSFSTSSSSSWGSSSSSSSSFGGGSSSFGGGSGGFGGGSSSW
jgi:uncharacterized membrane protein YgcG